MTHPGDVTSVSALPPWQKTPPRSWQEDFLTDEHMLARAWGLLWEMGLGKSKVLIDVAVRHFLEKRIDALLVIAPNAVFSNWPFVEIPAHCAVAPLCLRYRTGGTERRKMQRKLMLDRSWGDGRMRIVAMSYDSLRTEDGLAFAMRFVVANRTMIVADESTSLKTWSAEQTKAAKRVRQFCPYAWIATGTPYAQSPFDAHSQVDFLDDEFWARHGMRSLGAFKIQYGVFKTMYGRGGQKYDKEIGFRRLDHLGSLLRTITSRLLKEDSGVNLPPKTYTTRVFDMAPRQRRVYDEISREMTSEIDSGVHVDASLAMTRLMRLQQVTSGHVTAEAEVLCRRPLAESESGGTLCARREGHDGRCSVQPDVGLEYQERLSEADPIRPKPVLTERASHDVVPTRDNPRLQLALSIVDEAVGKVIVWCRFKRDVEMLCEALGDAAVRYDGDVDSAGRDLALTRFRDPADPARVFVANVHAISQGVTLTIAKTMIYFSNSFSLERRLQSEDRFHRIGQDQPVQIFDLAARGTIDFRVIQALRSKYDIARLVTGDRYREWIGDETNTASYGTMTRDDDEGDMFAGAIADALALAGMGA